MKLILQLLEVAHFSKILARYFSKIRKDPGFLFYIYIILRLCV